ncbi:unnamed protein product [Linum tenue]|uniref:Uncharacterized protein n=1 Tax=Linum tenue TaxID=586396 RepID=A0AAV0M2K7_9ROSI|nr:unnamed protein product [Linum tenue]
MFRQSATKLFSPLRRRTFPSYSFCSQVHDDLGIRSTGTSMVKPSSPTPRHLAEFKLSLIDNYVPPLYTAFIFFYPGGGGGGGGGEGVLGVLKSSLAQALTRFYPLAGRLSRSGGPDSIPIIRCDDEGVPFATAVAGPSSMDRLLSRPPEIDALHRFLPFRPCLVGTPAGLESAPQLAVKATVFPCGGVAVGVCFLHKIGDGYTISSFLKLWAALARGGGDEQEVGGGGAAYAHDRAAASLFPARHEDALPAARDFIYEGGEGAETERTTVARRFVFDREAVAKLKLGARSEWVPNPTRFEAVSGLLWKSAVSATATALALDGKAGSVPGGAPRFSDAAAGGAQREELDRGARRVLHAEAGSRRREGRVSRNEATRTEMLARAGRSGRSKVAYFVMSSTFGMDVYGVDFGWGKPAWVSLAELPDEMNNVVGLINGPDGAGVEAWIFMHERELSILEEDPEILAYAKNNPSVL